jgi:hypothetical protein
MLPCAEFPTGLSHQAFGEGRDIDFNGLDFPSSQDFQSFRNRDWQTEGTDIYRDAITYRT